MAADLYCENDLTDEVIEKGDLKDWLGRMQEIVPLSKVFGFEQAADLHYYYDPPSIVDTGTSWLGDNAESALLYGSLVEAYTYLKGDVDIMTLYRQRYQEAMDRLFDVDIRSKRDDYRDGSVRVE